MASNRLLRGVVAWGGVAASAIVVLGAGCGSNSSKAGFTPDSGTGGGDSAGTVDGPGGGGDSQLFGDVNLDTGFNVDAGCATGKFAAEFLPAAMLVVLDGSGTMAANNKYATAEQAIISAIDEDSFDSASLGLLIYPTGDVTGPACVLNLPVTCAVPGLAQVPLNLAGPNKSSASSGVRHDIYNQLAASSPNTSGVGDGNPTYDAINNGIGILKAWPGMGKRILFVITDGGSSCTSLSTRPGYMDGNGCTDWEYPASIMSLVQAANQDPNTPVNTIFVGVPGADTDGTNVNDPPYHVRLALSAEAWAGSPQTCDPTCDGKTFTQAGVDPVVPCHFDMTQNFTPALLSAAINKIRGSLLGCVFDIPPAADGGIVDPTKVNVEYSTNGTTYTSISRRASPSDTCTTAPGCWDYNSTGQIVLEGAACNAIEGAMNADVQIVLGCKTITM